MEVELAGSKQNMLPGREQLSNNIVELRQSCDFVTEAGKTLAEALGRYEGPPLPPAAPDPWMEAEAESASFEEACRKAMEVELAVSKQNMLPGREQLSNNIAELRQSCDFVTEAGKTQAKVPRVQQRSLLIRRSGVVTLVRRWTTKLLH